MPDSFAGLFIIIIGVFPGVIGDKVYRSLVGVDWREKEWQGIVRLIGFSVVGLAIYAFVAEQLNLIPPLHIFPSTYSSAAPQKTKLTEIFLPYCGHLVGGLLAGFLGAWGAKILSKFSSNSAYPSAWDEFIRCYVQRRWVVIGLENGEVYAGKIKIADISSGKNERDLVLEEPALYDPSTSKYISTSYQYMFIKAKELYSMAAIYEPGTDCRIVPVGQDLFNQGDKND
jgi:hypothetical protein